MNLPPNTKKYNTRRYNTLHGFDYDDGRFSVALIPEALNEERCATEIKEKTGVDVQYGEFIGHHYVSVGEADREKIPEVIDALLSLLVTRVEQVDLSGYVCTFVAGFDVVKSGMFRRVTPEGHVTLPEHELDFQPSITLLTALAPTYFAGDTYSLATSEYKMLCEKEDRVPRWYHACPRLWKTTEGKQWAERQRTLNMWDDDEFVDSNGSEFTKDGWFTKLAAGSAEDERLDYPLSGVL